MFGPAFLDAYHIETTIAKYPRVILSRETYGDFQTMSGLTFPQVLLGEDGPPYLHVLANFEQLNRTPGTIESSNDDEMLFAITCQKAIQNLLDDSIHEPKHYEKLRWLAIYWNSTVATGPGPLTPIKFPLLRNLAVKQ